MSKISQRMRIWGWYFFDWASQPYNTLILTFIFGPYFAQTATEMLMQGGADQDSARAMAQAYWGYGLSAGGIFIALSAPVLGAISDHSGRRLPWIWLFSVMYFVGAFGLWWSARENFSILYTMVVFCIGYIGMEFATIFTNSYLSDLGGKNERGKISADGWAFGYLGGVIALILMLTLFQATPSGKTLIGISPLFGLDVQSGADTRIVGPMVAIWFAVFMIPFFWAIKETPSQSRPAFDLGAGMRALWGTIKSLPQTPSYFAYLGSSMFYRDALNGMYTFGGIYALGVMDWSITQVGVFGILAAISGAFFCWVAGFIDRKIGPKPVIVACNLILIGTALLTISLTPTSVLWLPVESGSALPDIMFYVAGALIGAAGGVLQASSRNMLTRQVPSTRITEGFGLYALSGRATTFLAPFLIAFVSQITQSQRIGITPLIALFLIGLVMLIWVDADGVEDEF